jgi:hypothetical protein
MRTHTTWHGMTVGHPRFARHKGERMIMMGSGPPMGNDEPQAVDFQ